MTDYWAALCGVPGSGKTTRAKERAVQLANAGRWVWIHDVGRDFQAWCPTYPHPRAWLDATRKGQPMPRIARFVDCSADDVLLAVRSLNKHRADSDRPTVPLAVVIDEGCMIGGERRHAPSFAMMELLARRRHLDCAVVVNIQWPTQVYFGFLSTATELDCFNNSDEESIKKLVRYGFPRRHAHLLPQLGRGQYLNIRRNPFDRA